LPRARAAGVSTCNATTVCSRGGGPTEQVADH
jgi:hypothetical protein